MSSKAQCIRWEGELFTEGCLYDYRVDGPTTWVRDNEGQERASFLDGDQPRFKIIKKQETKMPQANTAHSESYEFKVMSEDQVDIFEVHQSLTRKRPMGIIHTSNGKCAIMLHNCINQKAQMMPKRYLVALDKAMDELEGTGDEYDSWGTPHLVSRDSKKISAVTKAVKDIRNGQVKKKYRQKLTVKVDLITI